jgi:hypothetical protein
VLGSLTAKLDWMNMLGMYLAPGRGVLSHTCISQVSIELISIQLRSFKY